MNIGILGGTFNPIHNGHLCLARRLIEKGLLDKVLFVVSARPPHKDAPIVSPKQRYEMVCLALQNEPNFIPCDLELNRPGNSYTLDTMRVFRAAYPKDKLFFITGADMFIDIPGWKSPKDLFREVSFLVADRSGAFENARYKEKVAAIEARFSPTVQFVAMETPQISSTELRADANKRKMFLPEAVYAYIQQNKLYE